MGEWRTAKYETPKQMEKAIIAYFKECEKKKKRPTKPGLALSLGFASRQSLWDNGNQRGPEFKRVIKKAHTMIEDALCQLDSAMAIFQLKTYYALNDREGSIELDESEANIDEAYL